MHPPVDVVYQASHWTTLAAMALICCLDVQLKVWVFLAGSMAQRKPTKSSARVAGKQIFR